MGEIRTRGFTITEVMIALTLGLLVAAAVSGILVSTSRSYREDAKSAHVHEDLSIAMAQITEDLEMAGFWAGVLQPTRIDVENGAGGSLVSAPGNDCWSGLSYVHSIPGNTAPIQLADNVTGATAHAAFGCISAADVQVGTDIVAIRRLVGAVTAGPNARPASGPPTSCTAASAPGADVCGRVYLRTNGSLATLFQPTSRAPNPVLNAVPAPYDDWEYRIAVYFIRNYSATAGDGVPALCRYVLQSGPSMSVECIAQGIENLQLEVGVDTNSDGRPDYYTSDITTPSVNTVVAARVTILARSVDFATTTGAADTLLGRTGLYSSGKTYTLAGGGQHGAVVRVATSDHYYRKMASSVALLRNPDSLCEVFGCS